MRHLRNLSPESATSLGIDVGVRAGLRFGLTDRSAEGQRRIARQLRSDLDRLNSFSETGLSFSTRTSVDVVRSAYATALEGFALPYGDITVGGWRNTPYVVIQNVGAYLDIPRFLDSDHPHRERRRRRGVSRAAAVVREAARRRARTHAGGARSWARPAGVPARQGARADDALGEERARGRVARRVDRAPDEEHSGRLGGARADDRSAGGRAGARSTDRASCEAQRAVATNDAGISARPHGEEFYRWALKASTTTTMSPDEIHELGQNELKRPARADGRDPQGDRLHAGQRWRAHEGAGQGSALQVRDGDKGRAEIMAFINDRLDWIRAQMPRAFNTVVNPNMEVKRLPPEEEPGAPAAYGGAGSIDGKIPGRFWINLRTTDLHSKYSLADLTFHESIPGHIWQGEYTHDMPLIRQMLAFNAYSEGWALYAEQLADELGAYDNDRVGRLGYLQSLAFRACRLVVDTGIHAKRWTREQGVQFFVDVNGSNPQEVASEVDRYCSWPGQACGYKVGHSEINRQRDRRRRRSARSSTSRRSTIPWCVGGNVPLDVLARNVDEYLRTATG